MKPAIGIYMPGYLYRSDKTDRLFRDGLVRAIRDSSRYTPILINIPKLRITTRVQAEGFSKKHGLKMILEHDSYFYSDNPHYKTSVQLLAEVVPFINKHSSHDIAHDKIATSKILREHGIPVLDQKIVTTVDELRDALTEDSLYVVKPADRGAGAGVRLIKRTRDSLWNYRNGEWLPLVASDITTTDEIGLKLQRSGSFLNHDRGYIYSLMIVEPFFNDSETEFSSLRCTVIGDQVIESVRRVNGKNITSNIVSGGKAEKIKLNEEQKSLAIAAMSAIGADYAGVDMLVRGNETVIGEINIGPFTTYERYTGVPVGKLLGEYLIRKCDEV